MTETRLVETKNLGRGNCGAEHAGCSGRMPADGTELRLHSTGDAAFRFEAKHHRCDKVAPAHAALLGQCEQNRKYGCRRVNRGGQVRIVEVEHVRAHAVDEGRMHDIEPFCPAE